MSAPALFEVAVSRSEYVWVVCPRCGDSFECTGIRDVIVHGVSAHLSTG